MACASPSYLRARGTPRAPSDLTGHECLGYACWSRPVEGEWHFTGNDEPHAVRVSGRLQVNDGRVLLSAAADGFGIILGPEDVLRDAMASGRLVGIMPDFDGPSRPMHLLFAPDRRQTPKLRGFIDAAAATLGVMAMTREQNTSASSRPTGPRTLTDAPPRAS